MNSLFLVLSAAIGQAGEEVPAPVWQQNYTHAFHMAAQQKKPIAVFLAPGENGIKTLVQGGLSEQARQILAKKYIPVMIDTTTPEGQRLMRAFQLRENMGVVISDRSGIYQAFWHQGPLTSQDLARNLERYADRVDVRVTERNGHTSLYPPDDQQPSPDGRMMTRQGDGSYYPQNERRRILRNRSSEGRVGIFQGRFRGRSSRYYY